MKIVYLHGVGTGDAKMTWLDGLNQGLVQSGYEPVSENDVIAPRYAGLLGVTGVKAKHPRRTYTDKHDDEARRTFVRRQARVQRMLNKTGVVRTFGLGRVPGGVLTPIQAAAIGFAPGKVLKQVHNYLADVDLQGAVLAKILDDIPPSGDIILIGHSLGSVIAIDLLDHLPENLHVARFITIGSPAGSPSLHKNSERILKRFPYARVDDWSNFLDCYDPVTAGRGLSGIFPGAQDFGIPGAKQHSAYLYLRNSAVAELVADALYPSHEIVASSKGIALRLSDADATALLALRYAHRVAANITDKGVRKRFEGAVNVLQDNLPTPFWRTKRAVNRPGFAGGSVSWFQRLRGPGSHGSW